MQSLGKFGHFHFSPYGATTLKFDPRMWVLWGSMGKKIGRYVNNVYWCPLAICEMK